MALKILYTRVNGTLTADVSAASTLLPVDADTLALLQAQVNFGGGDWTYLTLYNDIYSEEVKVIGTQSTYLTVIRGVSGSTPEAFTAAETGIVDHVGADAVKDIIAANPSPSSVTVGGTGLAEVSQPTSGNYVVNVVSPTFTGTDGIAITGVWPNIGIAYEGGNEGCCGGGGGSSGTGVGDVVITSSILSGSVTDGTLTLALAAPTFEGAGGVTVSGSWATGYTISGGGGGGTGTVVSVEAGTGLTLTGSPSTNPTLSLTATGISAGTYGGFTFNAQGQLTGVDSGYAPIGSLAFSNGATTTASGTSYTVTLETADVGVQGIVALADSGAPIDPNDDTTAVTPKMLAAALSTSAGSISGAGASTGEADASYTNVLSSTAITLTLATGQKALILGEVEGVNTTPTTQSTYGVGVFNSSGVKIYGSKTIPQNKQTVMFLLTGPVSATNMSLVTTALDAADSITSSFLAAVVF